MKPLVTVIHQDFTVAIAAVFLAKLPSTSTFQTTLSILLAQSRALAAVPIPRAQLGNPHLDSIRTNLLHPLMPLKALDLNGPCEKRGF
jgi:hypothetical protein